MPIGLDAFVRSATAPASSRAGGTPQSTIKRQHPSQETVEYFSLLVVYIVVLFPSLYESFHNVFPQNGFDFFELFNNKGLWYTCVSMSVLSLATAFFKAFTHEGTVPSTLLVFVISFVVLAHFFIIYFGTSTHNALESSSLPRSVERFGHGMVVFFFYTLSVVMSLITPLLLSLLKKEN